MNSRGFSWWWGRVGSEPNHTETQRDRDAGGEKRAGFTLLELAATLAILAVTTAVAAHQLAGQRHRAARERSDRMLDELAAGAEAFAADMGRLPRMVAAGGEGGVWGLGELSSMPEGAAGFGAVAVTPESVCGASPAGFDAALDGKVSLAAGWRGPYVATRTGGDGVIRDGWGNAMTAGGSGAWRLTGDGSWTDAAEGAEIRAARHLGSDGEADGSEWASTNAWTADVSVDWGRSMEGTAVVEVEPEGEGEEAAEVKVRVYVPCGCEGGDGGRKVHILETNTTMSAAVFGGLPRGRHPATVNGAVRWVEAR